MSNGTRLFGCCLVAAMVSMIAVRESSAQERAPGATAAAVALEQQANVWLGTPAKWRGVARSLERAAELRGPDDPIAIKNLFLAAAARIWVGDREAAQAAFTKAAEWSLANGDVEAAANGFTRAAVVAFEHKDIAAARELRDRAARLARSPLLSTVQRQAILNQFVPGPAVIAAHK